MWCDTVEELTLIAATACFPANTGFPGKQTSSLIKLDLELIEKHETHTILAISKGLSLGTNIKSKISSLDKQAQNRETK